MTIGKDIKNLYAFLKDSNGIFFLIIIHNLKIKGIRQQVCQ